MSYRRPVGTSIQRVNETEFPAGGAVPSRLGRTLDRPPGGVCGARLSCRNPATKWIGAIDDTDTTMVKRVAIGVCDQCFTLITTGRLDSPVGGMLSDASPSVPPCAASTAEHPSQGGGVRVLPPGPVST